MPSVTWLATDHFRLGSALVSLTEDREGTDPFPEANFACYFLKVLPASPVPLKKIF